MTDSRNASKPWTLSWVHMALALAVGAGLPVLWVWLAPSAQAVAVADAGAGQRQTAGVPVGQGAAQAVPVAEPAQRPVPAAPLPVASPVPAPAPQIPRMRDPNGDQSPDITDFINQGEVPTMAEVISRLHAAGVHGGLGAFNPPGTRPPLVGIAVSEDFELPPGYVRHHQVTDDGQRIEPILMFSPDHPLVAAAGPGSTRPQDRVVPPALVPPGLPIRNVVVPPPAEPGTEPRK
ncbi:MAG: hypothetical protein HZC37_04220 [Burkholderiales bacterium]|nr:hypothetical protein [Burkholderiales bacterium]